MYEEWKLYLEMQRYQEADTTCIAAGALLRTFWALALDFVKGLTRLQ